MAQIAGEKQQINLLDCRCFQYLWKGPYIFMCNTEEINSSTKYLFSIFVFLTTVYIWPVHCHIIWLTLLFFPRPACKASGRWHGATFSHGASSKNWRGSRDKNKTRLSLSSGLLYSGDVYSSTDDQDTNC